MKQTYLPFSNPKLPPGAVFAAKKSGVSITGYKSRKVMFQGVNGEAEAKKWVATLPESKAKAPSVSKGFFRQTSHQKMSLVQMKLALAIFLDRLRFVPHTWTRK